MIYASIYSKQKQNINSTEVTRELLDLLKEAGFFAIGKLTQILIPGDRQAEPIEVISLEVQTRLQLLEILVKAIVAEVTRVIEPDMNAKLPTGKTALHTLKTLIELKLMLENKAIEYISFD